MQLPLSDGAYQAKSIIASAQRCVNLYTEKNPIDSPFPSTHYLTPGLVIKVDGPSVNPVRCSFRASNGELFVVIGTGVYYVDAAFNETSLGSIGAGTTPVSMQDNGLVVLIGDGTINLYVIDLVTHSFSAVAGSNFYGADRIDYVDTFFILNRPGTNQWYISLSEANYAQFTGTNGGVLTGSISNAGNTGAIGSAYISAAGTGYPNGTYSNIPLIGGTGTGTTAIITVSGNFVSNVSVILQGINYTAGDLLTVNSSDIGTKASGTYTFTTNPTATQTIILNGVTWTFVASGATGSQTNIQGTTALTLTQLAVDLNASANASINIASYTVSPTVLTITYKVNGTAGNAYTLAAGTYAGAISGGTLSGGVNPAGSGFVYTILTVQGSYTNGTYTGVSLTGGSGTGAKATIVVTNHVVTTVTITTAGSAYLIGDVLSAAAADIGGTGSGFVYTVLTITSGAFDALDIATKNGYPDNIQGCIVMHREIWIIGTLTSEIWYNSGAADFTFQTLPGTFIEHGCIAKYSICKQDLSVYWLSQDEQGQAIVIRGTEYSAIRISTHAMEAEFVTYPTISDAIGFTYQQEGHTYYVLIFPTANKTWVYDQAVDLWHQRTWTDENGNLNRHRMNCGCNAYNQNIVGDWENGQLYALSQTTYTDDVDGLGPNDDGTYPISRIRSWPAIVNEGNRVAYQSFVADMQVGDVPNTTIANPPLVSLRFSDDRGRTYGTALQQSLGAQGLYLTNMSWNRLGLSRGRVFELSWSCPGPTALNGAWIEITPALS